MAGWLFLQGREHTPHGNLVQGPGFVSRSPERMRMQASQEADPGFERQLMLRTQLFLTFLLTFMPRGFAKF